VGDGNALILKQPLRRFKDASDTNALYQFANQLETAFQLIAN
jgi:hypothetical protein